MSLLLAETLGFVINQVGNKRERAFYCDPGLVAPDKVLGYKPAPAGNFHATLSNDNQLLYDVHYRTDQYSRRITPVKTTAGRTNFALFFGCSHIFGEGVAGNETLPYYFGNDMPDYMPYNYGFLGYGPQHALLKLRFSLHKKEIPEKTGACFYFYLGRWHVYRAIGEMAVSNNYGHFHPCFEMGEDNKLVWRGIFETARPILFRVYKVLGTSQFLRAFDITFPPFLRESHYALTARIIKETQEEYERLFKNEYFYVVILPWAQPSSPIIPQLKKEGIKYFDYSTLIDLKEGVHTIKGDGHPAPFANRIIAEHLAADVQAVVAQ